MAEEFRLPNLGENVKAGVVVRISAAVGDEIEVDQPVLEIETDKAVAEVPSPVRGKVVSVHVKEGDEVKPGDLILTVESAPAAPAGAPAAAGTDQAPAPRPEPAAPVASAGPVATAPAAQPTPAAPQGAGEVEFRLPNLGESVRSGVVVRVAVAPGDVVETDQVVLEIETDKAVAEVPSPVRGRVKAVHVKEGDEVKPGDLIFTAEGEGMGAASPAAVAAAPVHSAPAGAAAPAVQESAPARQEPPASRPAAATAAAAAIPAPSAGERPVIPAAPSTRRFAREIGVDIAKVPGTGPNGRISIEDVKAYARRLNEQRQAAAAAVPAGEPLPDFSKWGEVERRPMRGVRRVTAERLSQAWVTVPQVTQFDKADVTELEKLRKKYAPKVEAAGGKLTPTAILLKVVAAALKVFPQFNTSVDMAGQEIIYKKYIHIGVAVDTEHGLLVPVIRDVDKKNLVELSVELTQIAKKARERKLTADDMQGGCFTISNLGGIGGTAFTPIVNAPEVAILGVSRGVVEPVWDGTSFVPRTMMPLSLSYDHRVIDGADGARFLRWVAEALEQPFVLLLEG